MPIKFFFRESIRGQLWGWPIYCLLTGIVNYKLKPDITILDMALAWLLLFCAFNACVAILYILVDRRKIAKACILIILLYVLLTEVVHQLGGAWVELKEELFSSKREQYYWRVFNNYIAVWMMAGAFVFHIRARMNERLRQHEMALRHQKEIEAKEMQFALRTAQVSPHFLLNVLAGIQGKALDVSPAVARDVEQVADIMQYMLSVSDHGKKKVLLLTELGALERYLNLQRSRHEKLYIEYRQEGTVTTQKIVPFALITLVENAFKYGLYTLPNRPIKIGLKLTDNEILFTCENVVDKGKTEAYSMKLGLKNLRTRLGIAFPQKYTLLTEKREKDKFYVELHVLQH